MAPITGANVEIHIKTSLFGFFLRVCIRCAFEASYEKFNLNIVDKFLNISFDIDLIMRKQKKYHKR